jgi:polysaccharide biosynthesis/export protein
LLLCHKLICVVLLALSLAACSGGPSGGEVIAQARSGGRVSFDVVDLTPPVVATLLAHQPPPFAARFAAYAPPPRLTLAVGDRVSVVIWEAAASGLFGNSLAQLSLPAGSAAELSTGQVPNPGTPAPLPSGLTPSPIQLAQLYGLSGNAATAAVGEATAGAGSFVPPEVQQLLAVAIRSGRPGTVIPDQPVGVDGGISVPYAGRIEVAHCTPPEVAQIIEARLRPIAIDPQVVVIVTQTAANSVTVTGDAVRSARVPLPLGGARLLQVIAAAGGTKGRVRDIEVILARGGVTAGLPLTVLISDPAQNIFAKPGDVLTVGRRPRTFSVFGATQKNTAIRFSRDPLSLSQALGDAGGLLDDRADARAVFVMRYERDSVVRALGEPIASDAPDGVSPVAYRLDLKQANSLLLARRFRVHDDDVIFVADAATQPIYDVFQALLQLTGPVVTGFVTCQTARC